MSIIPSPLSFQALVVLYILSIEDLIIEKFIFFKELEFIEK